MQGFVLTVALLLHQIKVIVVISTTIKKNKFKFSFKDLSV